MVSNLCKGYNFYYVVTQLANICYKGRNKRQSQETFSLPFDIRNLRKILPPINMELSLVRNAKDARDNYFAPNWDIKT